MEESNNISALDEQSIIKHKERIQSKSEPLENAIHNIVESHTHELNIIIHQIKGWLKDETTELTDLEINDILLQLPILLFDETDDQEIVGMQSDLSTQVYKEAYNEAYKIARGTVADKTSVAELNAMRQKLDTFIYDRAYRIIRQRINMAIEVLNAVKKVQISRQQRNELDNRYRRF